MSTLAPNSSLVISSKQSSIVSTVVFVKTMFGIGLDIEISRSSTSDLEQISGLHGGASMNSSSEMPNLHLKYSNIGSKGLRNVGIRQLSLALSKAAA